MNVIMIEAEYLILIAAVAFLYSSVGHAGASGYIAVLTLAGWSSVQVRPLALLLNILVAALASYRFWRAGYFLPKLFIPIVALSIPAAILGGYVELPTRMLSKIIGVALQCSAVWLLTGKRDPTSVVIPKPLMSISSGGIIGFLAGLTGTGGGIFLSPLMLYLKWARLKQISAVAAPYIFVNSVAGLIGLSLRGYSVPVNWMHYVVAAALGGIAGSTLGVRALNPRVIQALLSAVLFFAGSKLLFLS